MLSIKIGRLKTKTESLGITKEGEKGIKIVKMKKEMLRKYKNDE